MFDRLTLFFICVALIVIGIVGSLISFFVYSNYLVTYGFMLLVLISCVIYMRYLYIG